MYFPLGFFYNYIYNIEGSIPIHHEKKGKLKLLSISGTGFYHHWSVAYVLWTTLKRLDNTLIVYLFTMNGPMRVLEKKLPIFLQYNIIQETVDWYLRTEKQCFFEIKISWKKKKI